ncbi:probable transcription factor PosF21 [Zingiber officinale]|uniref:probable transcription factor PosF21 n=1 Tax=Zingiber officinale TaxID=94328 RepID=UPI001C4CD243|nr:probable transcription factor PosF21 [Zingiber officinale]
MRPDIASQPMCRRHLSAGVLLLSLSWQVVCRIQVMLGSRQADPAPQLTHSSIFWGRDDSISNATSSPIHPRALPRGQEASPRLVFASRAEEKEYFNARLTPVDFFPFLDHCNVICYLLASIAHPVAHTAPVALLRRNRSIIGIHEHLIFAALERSPDLPSSRDLRSCPATYFQTACSSKRRWKCWLFAVPALKIYLFASPLDSYGFTNDPSVSSSSQPLDSGQFGHPTPSDAERFSYDVSRMPDCPPKNSGHRRAHSEILSLLDDFSFGSDLGVVRSHDEPSLSDETGEDLPSMFVDAENFSSCATSSSLSICEVSPAPDVPSGSSERPRMRHRHSQSLDGSTAIKPEFLLYGGEGSSSMETKKAMPAAKLAELALVDLRRAKRILANRQSAARLKERKMRYISELQWKAQTLQTEAPTLSAQLNVLQSCSSPMEVI